MSSRTGVVTFDFVPLIGGIGRHTSLMYSKLKEMDLLFFSPCRNDLPGHVRIAFPPVRFLKQVGVSIWLHFNAEKIVSDHRLERLNIHTGPGGVLLVRKVSVPVIVTCHHTYLQQVRNLPSQFWKWLFVPFERRTYRLAAEIVAVSEATKRALVDSYNIGEEKIRVIHNAVDTARFHPSGDERVPESILYVGRIDKRKGIELLVRSMPFVLRQIPQASLAIGGKGPFLERMKSLVKRLNIERNVAFLGFVPDELLNGLYGRAQCVVVPSVFEGFGITVIEALAAGTRVVGTDVDGIREILQDGECGELVPYGDAEALANAIVRELRNPRTVQALQPKYRDDQFRKEYSEVFQGGRGAATVDPGSGI